MTSRFWVRSRLKRQVAFGDIAPKAQRCDWFLCDHSMQDSSIYQCNIQAVGEKIKVPFIRSYTNVGFLYQPVTIVNPTHKFIVLCNKIWLGEWNFLFQRGWPSFGSCNWRNILIVCPYSKVVIIPLYKQNLVFIIKSVVQCFSNYLFHRPLFTFDTSSTPPEPDKANTK